MTGPMMCKSFPFVDKALTGDVTELTQEKQFMETIHGVPLNHLLDSNLITFNILSQHIQNFLSFFANFAIVFRCCHFTC